ncbi:transcription elongation factor GreA [Deinococcus sp. KNUC1210]|uniref:GreA/GreB family elongation factor n=1 Tax=Deinococcus sp. KNUC1210 TaxID=2917691 RepID=UPI001EF160D9|nr:transcription elongation factor GreA [Deinococcus sp. KNUC1210]ULH15658.1 transcription elongation factor GreA [Deinococcus sp. KNUC1210]
MAEKMKMTRKGYDQLKLRLDYLRTTRRDEISDNMGTALADGDLRESAAYDEARMQQSENEAQILNLEYQLENALIVEEGTQDGVGLGARIRVQDASGKQHTFEIVGTYEADSLKGKISDQSPIGQALAGQKEGATVTVQMPRGKQEFKILEVKYE